jgi:hypothetical protein
VADPLPNLDRRSRPLLSYALAVGSVAAAACLVAVVDVVTAAALTPLMLFAIAVAVAGACGGLRPGLAAAGLAILASNFLFIHPRYELSFDWTTTRLAATYAASAPISSLVATHAARAARAVGAIRGRRRDVGGPWGLAYGVAPLVRSERARLLAETPLFSGLSPDDLSVLAGLLDERRVPDFATLYREGDAGDRSGGLYLVLRGRVEVHRGRRLADVLGPGGSVGELSMLDGGPHTETIRARTGVTLLMLRRADFRQFLLERPAAAAAVLAELGRRQRDLDSHPPVGPPTRGV